MGELLRDWCIRTAIGDAGPRLAFSWAFLEAIVLPLPPEILLIPLALADPAQSMRLAAIAVIGSLSGGMVSFGLGRTYGMRAVAWLERLPGVQPEAVLWASLMLRRLGPRFIALSSWFVLPYKISSVLSGSLGVAWRRYLLAGAVGRGTRIFAPIMLVSLMATPARAFVQSHFLMTMFLAYAAVGMSVWAIRNLLLARQNRWAKTPR